MARLKPRPPAPRRLPGRWLLSGSAALAGLTLLAALALVAQQGRERAEVAHERVALLARVLADQAARRLGPGAAGRPGPLPMAQPAADALARELQGLAGAPPLRVQLLPLAGPPPAGQATSAADPPRATLALALAAGQVQGLLQGDGQDGKPAVIAWQRLPGHALLLWVEAPAAAMQAQQRGFALKVAAGTTLLLALLALLAWRSLRSQKAASGDLAAARGTLAARDAFTDRLFQVSPIPLVVKDAAGRFLRLNKAWTELTGLTPERAIGLNLGRLYPAQLAAPHEVQEQMAITTGLPVTYEEQMLDSDGLPRDVMIRLMPYTDADDQVDGVIGCLMDVTEFREAAQRTLEAKEAAERANAAKSEFLANISHELRTPLQSILGFSELGASRSRADARLQGMFADIHGAGTRMLSLVNNLLDLSRLESTVGEIQLRRMDISAPLRAVAQELGQMAQARRLRLQLPPEGQAPLWADADDFRLQQVLRNVLANAIRFAPEGSEISLDWRPQRSATGEETLQLSVRDHGPGIPDDELESIFEAFVQSSRTKDGSGGTGLGLAICRKIMAAHQGRISARNHAEGGAVFDIHLPARPAPTVLAVPAPVA